MVDNSVGASRSAQGSARLRSLDGLRLVAALMVAAYHFTARSDTAHFWGSSPKDLFPHLSAAAAYGPLGVQLFFLISGFVICMSSWGRTTYDFFRSRVSRLYPAYWAALVLITIACLIAPSISQPLRLDQFLVNTTMLQEPMGVRRAIGVDWTLWVEVRFYVLFALLVVSRGVTYRRVVSFSCLWIVATVLASQTDNEIIQQVVMPEYAPFFVGGLALYLIHRFGSDLLLWSIVAVSWALAQWYAIAGMWRPNAKVVYLERSPVVILLIVTLAYVAVAAAALGWLRWAHWRWLTVAGALTYPFYLVHEHLGWFSITLLSRRWGWPPELTLVTTFLLMLGLAFAIHHIVERRLGPRLKRALDHQRPAVVRALQPQTMSTANASSTHPAGHTRAVGVDAGQLLRSTRDPDLRRRQPHRRLRHGRQVLGGAETDSSRDGGYRQVGLDK